MLVETRKLVTVKYLLLTWPISYPESTAIGIEQDGHLIDYTCPPGEYYGEPNLETRRTLFQNGWLPKEISKDQYSTLKSLWSNQPNPPQEPLPPTC